MTKMLCRKTLTAVLLLLSFSAGCVQSHGSSSSSSSSSSNDVNSPPTPTILWRTTLLAGSSNTSFGTPVLAGGLVGVLGVDETSQTAFIFTLEAATGQLLWNHSVPYVEEASGWIASGLTDSGVLAFFAGSTTGVAAFNAQTGAPLWTYVFTQRQQVSAHPTYTDGLVFVACENGELSAPVLVLGASDGSLRYQTEDLAFTLVWPSPAGVVVYCGLDPKARAGDTGVACLARKPATGEVVWALRNLTSTALNNNPNLDVGPAGVFMYAKPVHDLRIVSYLDAYTGAILWNLQATGDIDDYDTFTWGRRFYRLVSLNETTFMVQAVSVLRHVIWTSHYTSSDLNVNILVGGGGVFGVAFYANEINAFNEADGSFLWKLSVPNPSDGAVDDAKRVLYFGDGQGGLNAVSIPL